MQYPAFLIKGFAGAGSAFSKIQLAVYIIFNQWNLLLRDQLHQFLLSILRHTAAHGVVEIGNDYNGRQFSFLQHSLQCFQVETSFGIRSYFNCLQPQGFNGLMDTKIVGRFHRYRVTGFSDCSQGNGNRFQTSVGYYNIICMGFSPPS